MPLALLSVACTAEVGPGSPADTGVGGTNGTGGSGASGMVGVAPANCDVPFPGSAPMRRLSRTEYNNTVADLLGDKSHPGDLMPGDGARFSYETSIASHGITAPLVDQYLQVAEKAAAHVLANLDSALPCKPADGEESCARAYIAQLCPTAFRRPCAVDDTEPLFAMWQEGRAAGDFKLGVEYLLEMVLQSADFLYRPEFGEPATAGKGYVRLTGAELATRLSYYFWATMPDPALSAAAEAGQLATNAGVAVQAKRLLQDPRAHEAVQRFHEQWLGLDALETLTKSDAYSGFSDARSLMKQETRAFVDALFTENADLGTLLTAPYSYSNDSLERFYGFPAVGSGETFKRVARDSARYAGILTQGGFLSVYAKINQSAPIMRGVQVLRQVLCAELPPPPANVKFAIPEPSKDTTTRARFEQHEADPACSGCHQVIDSIGFGFEKFDGVGRFRDAENGQPVDASGKLIGTDADGAFNGVVELAQKLSGSEQVRRCYARNVFYNAHGRPAATEDQCSVAQLQTQFKASSYRLQDLAVAITQTDAFLYRTPVTP